MKSNGGGPTKNIFVHFIHTHIQFYVHTYAHGHIHTHTHIQIHIHTQSKYFFIYKLMKHIHNIIFIPILMHIFILVAILKFTPLYFN